MRMGLGRRTGEPLDKNVKAEKGNWLGTWNWQENVPPGIPHVAGLATEERGVLFEERGFLGCVKSSLPEGCSFPC